MKTIQVTAIVAAFSLFGMLAAGAMRPNERLSREVRSELIRLPQYGVFDYLEFRLAGNIVILEGSVRQPSLKAAAERAAANVEGVSRVINRVEVLPASERDERLRQSVYRSIYFHPSFYDFAAKSVTPVRIIVENGEVDLRGTVPDESTRETAESRAKTAKGVSEVENSLAVRR